MDWKQIPRKLRAGLVQINGNLTITITDETKRELMRREWIEEALVMRFIDHRGNREQMWGLRLTFEGQKIFEGRYSK